MFSDFYFDVKPERGREILQGIITNIELSLCKVSDFSEFDRSGGSLVSLLAFDAFCLCGVNFVNNLTFQIKLIIPIF